MSRDNKCHILILGDFSGRDNLSLNDVQSLKTRKVFEVDRDNIDEIFQRMSVKYHSPLAEEELVFKEMDDLHPDFIYENVELFSRLRVLKRKLNNPQTFNAAADEIYQWSQQKETQPDDKSSSIVAQQNEANQGEGSILENVLSNSQTSNDNSAFDIQALIKDIVAPYVQPKPDPRLEELLATIDDATSNLMRQLLHDGAFQNIESVWQSLNLLVRRIETTNSMKIFIADVSQKELIEDSVNDFEQSGLYQLIVSSRSSIGDTPYNLVMHTDRFGQDIKDIEALQHLSKVASKGSAVAVTSVTERLAGCESLALTPDLQEWGYTQNQKERELWEAFRKTPEAAHLIAVAPRYLSRMPYGQKSMPIESFRFEELDVDNRQSGYLWSSGAWLVVLLMAQNFSTRDSLLAIRQCEVDNLPLHVYDEDGESMVTPCAEVNMSDKVFEALKEVGICCIRSIKNKDSVLIPGINTVGYK
ncbi:hypothetical protein FLL45_00080 [Aliikangiella marina]|uniref:TssC1 N-terminal domain-containing protein n=1 Tax=Aliikangiella marina TaxID=1712262 RepID=A0A545TGZ0_9GAMM|nr:type VI secretion system contractile sheath large subunit [Aliikangiella marina]TQV76401.1 hypothetical protein FLL45_00080 [Aliikangiella marina]